MYLKRVILIAVLVFSVSICYSHGISSKIIKKGIIGISVKDELGKAFFGKVSIYAPNNKDEPVILSQLNKNGMFFFKPDKPGKWIALFRDRSGHGGRLTIQVNKDMIATSESNNLSGMHKIIIALSVCWGLIGTALFFMRKKKTI